MIQVSDAYKELVKSNIRPKCEPIIKISGIDNDGKGIELIWKAKNIKDLTYKRGIDPVGRELPYMELTWTEIYTGKLNAESYPEKYNNVTKYMAVELTFMQDLGFYNTWKTVYNSEKKWSDLFNSDVTWNELKKNASVELIKFPRLFLDARPTIKGTTITWKAKDVMYFLDLEMSGAMFPSFMKPPELPFFEALENAMHPAFQYYSNNSNIYDCLLTTAENLISISEATGYKLTGDICYEMPLNNLMLNYANLKNVYWNFLEDGSLNLRRYLIGENGYFKRKTMYSLPEISRCSNISVYSFKNYTHDNLTDLFPTKDDMKANNNNLTSNLIGEIFSEDNPINPYGENSTEAVQRFTWLKKYFNSDAITMKFEILPNLAVEPGDCIFTDTNLYEMLDGEEKEVIKQIAVVSIEIFYNGSIREKIMGHSYEAGLG